MAQGNKCTHGKDIIAEFLPMLVATLKMSAFCRFELLFLSPLSQLDYYEHRESAFIFVKVDAVCC